MEATYINATQFSISGDHTEEFIAGRRIRANCDVDGYKFSTIISSSYSAPNTTVTIEDSELTSNLIEVHYGLVSQGATGSLPLHSHDGSEGQGGQINMNDILITASGVEGYFIYTTNSGVAYIAPPIDGIDGDDGTNGLNFYSDYGAPSDSFGGPHEMYVNLDNYKTFKKDNFVYGLVTDVGDTYWTGTIGNTTSAPAFWNSWGSNTNTGVSVGVWYGVDLGVETTVRRVEIDTDGTGAARVEFSNVSDFSVLEGYAEWTPGGSSVVDSHDFLNSISARYIRVKIWDRYQAYSTNIDFLAILDTITDTWRIAGNIKGNSWIVDTVDPTVGDGEDFDLWLTETDKEVFVKDAPGWSGDLALNKPATADDSAAGNPPSYAVDGNTSTYWRGLTGTTAWFQVDLEGDYQINRLTLKTALWNSINAFELRGSNSADNSNYEVLVSGNQSGTQGTTTTYDFLTNTNQYRYYRLNMPNVGNEGAISDFELYSNDAYTWRSLGTISGSSGVDGVDGSDGADGATWHVDTVDPETADGNDFDLWLTETDKEIFVKDEPGWSSDLALSKSVTANQESTPYFAVNAVDGDSGTRWQITQSINGWIQVDLAAEYKINRLGIRNHAIGSLHDFELRASNSSDNSNYEVLVSDTHDDAIAQTYETYDFLSNTNTYRYYRLFCYDTPFINNVAVSDFELYNSDSYTWRSLGTISGSPGAPGQDAPDTFIGLSDTPTTYSGIEGNYLRVTASGIQAVDGVVLTAPDLSEWVLKVTVSGVLYTEAYSG